MKLAVAVICLLLAASHAQEGYEGSHSAEGGSLARVHVTASTRDQQEPESVETESVGGEEEPEQEFSDEQPESVETESVGGEEEPEQEFSDEQPEPVETESVGGEEEPEPVETESVGGEEEPAEEFTEEEPESVEETSVEGDNAVQETPDRGAVPCFYWDEECTSSYGVDFPGNDVAIIRTDSTGDCCSRCKETSGCLHWVARRTPDGGYLCHLKSIYGFPTYCDECTFSYTKSEACKAFCETTCHNLNQFGPAVCGTDGYTYESPCQMQCTGVSQAADGECDSPFRESDPHNY